METSRMPTEAWALGALTLALGACAVHLDSAGVVRGFWAGAPSAFWAELGVASRGALLWELFAAGVVALATLTWRRQRPPGRDGGFGRAVVVVGMALALGAVVAVVHAPAAVAIVAVVALVAVVGVVGPFPGAAAAAVVPALIMYGVAALAGLAGAASAGLVGPVVAAVGWSAVVLTMRLADAKGWGLYLLFVGLAWAGFVAAGAPAGLAGGLAGLCVPVAAIPRLRVPVAVGRARTVRSGAMSAASRGLTVR